MLPFLSSCGAPALVPLARASFHRTGRNSPARVKITTLMAVILHIAYYPGLQKARQIILEQAGYEVVSAFGNEEAMALARARNYDVIMVGFSAAHSIRSAILRWLKENIPQTPVVVLLANQAEHFPEADSEVLSENPDTWLDAVADCAGASGQRIKGSPKP
jgi:CheY-like chemotaxis protein